jgi:cytochrome c oxidase assembly protein subunit 15
MTLSALPPHARRSIGLWLIAVAGMVGLMVVIGGVTRLTESGLSMVEWRPIAGWLPPFSEGEWTRVFDLYRASPEYQKINTGMTLSEFQSIFWWEFIHRFWGRLIGLAFALPLAIFWLKGWVKPPLSRRLLVLLALGGLQGLIGWWMVKSGLVDRPDVSHYRLAVHLAMAFLIAGLLIWTALDLMGARPMPAPKPLRQHAAAIVWALSLVVILGAFVAGTNAGMIYNTFPLMDGGFTPPDMFDLNPWWRNGLENVATIQFNHRWAAILTALAVLWLWRRSGDLPQAQQRAAAMLATVAVLQAVLGVATLLSIVWIPLAAAHQAMALVLFLAAVWTLWTFRGHDPAP